MGKISIERDAGGVKGLCVITPQRYGDSRGWFMETYNQADLLAEGLEYMFVQDNHSLSTKGVLRGMHFQKNHPQAKLIRVSRGEVFDVVVDLREGSPTFGKWHGEILSADNAKQMLIPRGFAHGFLTLSDYAEFCYKCDEYYHPEDEGGVIWNDPEIGIEWPGVVGDYSAAADASGCSLTDGTPLILSEKDKKWLRLKETFSK